MVPSPSMYINRELSWLEFNQRVLEEARDASIPALERLKFLAITSSNLDEFFMVRVGGLQLLAEQDSGKRESTGMTPREQLAAISERTHSMVDAQYTCLLDDLEPILANNGIERLNPPQLDSQQREAVSRFVDDELFTILTPMLIASGGHFPLLVNHRLAVCVELVSCDGADEPDYAVIPLGQSVNRIIPLPSPQGYRYVMLEDAIRMHLDRFFPNVRILDSTVFRILRNADLSVQEDSASDLLSGMQQVLNARKRSACVRLELAANVGSTLRQFLQTALQVDSDHVYMIPGPIDLSAMMQLTGLKGFDRLRYNAWPPQPSPLVNGERSIFETVSDHVVLLCQPYETYDPVVRLVEEAADDPNVMAIKQILYRTSRNSPIVTALKRAAEKGKQVTVIVELKARFDEARNIGWAKRLEQAAVHVIYGVKGLKTHAKVCLVLRREPQGLRRYVHFGTGNYNEITSRLYSDISYMTCDELLAQDAVSFFNAVTGYSQPHEFTKIDMAPIGLRDKLLDLIESETSYARRGKSAHIMAQLNSLVDTKVINALYRASRAGVRVDLNIRGICCLRPGVPSMSENIRVVSILDRFLEHSRVFYFHDNGNECLFISSADWMPRNLLRRVELMIPVEDPNSKARLKEILQSYARDTIKGRALGPDGRYDRVHPTAEQPPHRHQEYMYECALQAAKGPV